MHTSNLQTIENMSKKSKTIISIKEIKTIFKEYCQKNGQEFSEEKLEKFLEFLEIDFYDWVKENLNQFNTHA